MNKDLTVGEPKKVLWEYCLPLFGSVIFQQLYNIADSLVAGKFIGTEALAAVGNSYEITAIFIAFAFGCNIGCSVIVAQCFGARKFKELQTAIWTTFIASGVLCLVLMLLSYFGCDYLLRLINTPDNIFKDSKLYLDIYIYGLPFVFFYNVATGIFGALGDSKTPFYFLACSSLSNIFIDILFVASFNMGVAGVAYATFLCQGVSCILAMVVIIRRFSILEKGIKAQKFSLNILKKLSSIAIPSIMQQSFISVGNVLIQSNINTFGSDVIAGYSASIKLNTLVVSSFTTFGNGLSNWTAQNLGATKFERINEGFKAASKIIFKLCIIIFILYFFFGRYILYIFMDKEATGALNTGIEFLRITSPFYFILAIKHIEDGILRGSGQMTRFMITTFVDLILKVILSFVLSRTFLGSTGIWMAWPLCWIPGLILSIYFYKTSDWNKIRAL